ncbi:4Fe-4S binding protein [bacterium]|nr:4Fe-4S binding protein [bacterium]
MWFRKAKSPEKEAPCPGVASTLDGQAAACAVERLVADVLVVQSTPELTELESGLINLVPGEKTIESSENSAGAIGTLTGAALTGARATALVSDLGCAQAELTTAVGKHAPFTVHLACHASERAASTSAGGQDDFFGACATGAFQFFASTAQQAADLAMIAHRVAELSFIPGVCGQDLAETAQSVQSLLLPDEALATAFLGHSSDRIATPSTSQEILLGRERRRVPRLIDVDHPAGLGGLMGSESASRAAVGHDIFFQNHVAEFIDQAFREYGELTGREYAPVQEYRADDAQYLVVCMGAIGGALREVIDRLREQKIKAGIASIVTWHPFPAQMLSHLLAKKKAITILERSAHAPITREVRAALDKATENTLAPANETPFPGFGRFAKPTDRPAIHTGLYGIGGPLPRFSELAAAVRNMCGKTAGKRLFYLGDLVAATNRRYPHLQAVQQRLAQAYPELPSLCLPKSSDSPSEETSSLRMDYLAAQGGLAVGSILAQSLAEASNWDVRTFAAGGLGSDLLPASLVIAYASDADVASTAPEKSDILLVASSNLLDANETQSSVKKRAHVIVATDCDPNSFWAEMPRSTAQWICKNELKITVVDAENISSEASDQPAFFDSLACWALIGAALGTLVEDTKQADVRKALRERLTKLGGEQLAAQIADCMQRAAEEAAELVWSGKDLPPSPANPEGDAPWTIGEDGADATVFNRARFWHSVGFLYDSGQPEQAATDPHLASGIIPAGSSAFRDLTPWRLRIPHWLPENCTGCASCWSQCPDSAMPSTVSTPSELIETVMNRCDGLVQLQRIQKHLAQQATTIVSKDDLGQFLAFGPLLDEAYKRLMDRMKPSEDDRKVFDEEFEKLQAATPNYTFSRTEEFFDSRDKDDRRLLTIAIDPMSCTACGLCLEVCPEGAIEWAEQSEEMLSVGRKDCEFQREVPAASISDLVSADKPQSQLNRLLDPSAYFSLVGGDGSLPGDSTKIAVHLITAAIHSCVYPRYAAHAKHLTTLIDRVRDRIQGKVDATLKINDFEAFHQKIAQLETSNVKPDALLGIFGDNRGIEDRDVELLKHLGHLLTSLEKQQQSYSGTVPSRTPLVLAIDRDGAAYWNATYPYNPHRNPWLAQDAGDIAGIARGMMEGIRQQIAGELQIVQEADDLVAAGVAQEVDAKHLLPPIVVLCDSAKASSASVAALLKSEYPVNVVLLNTDGADPKIDLLALARRYDAIALQSSIGAPAHLVAGVVDCMESSRPALLHVHAPHPASSGVAPQKIVAHAEIAVSGRVFPLFRYASGKLQLGDNRAASEDWGTHTLNVQKPGGDVEALEVAATPADWAVQEARFQNGFRKAPAGERGMPLAEYLQISEDERSGLHAFVRGADARGRQFLAILSPELIAFSEKKLAEWHELQRIASGKAPALVEEPASSPTPPEPVVVAETPEETRQKIVQRLLALSGYSNDPDFFRQSLREFLANRASEAEVGTES